VPLAPAWESSERQRRLTKMEYPLDTVTEGSKELLAQGIRVLQGNRFAPTEKEHVLKLAEHMGLNGEREVADMGCGFGEVSRILADELLPEAHFWLVNVNEFQLGECPGGKRFTLLREDMLRTSIPDKSVDLVMFNYSICHADDPFRALEEAARIARSGAKLFVYDYERIGGDNELTQRVLAAEFYTEPVFGFMCQIAGWGRSKMHPVKGDDTLFRKAAGNTGLYEAMFQYLRPVIWTARRSQ
jgi:SAM-dependent methyltransferase